MLHDLEATPGTVHWGYYDSSLNPVLEINSGDSVNIETVTLPYGFTSELPFFGFEENEVPKEFLNIYRENLADRGPGPHLLTGPILIEDAEPGDVLEVETLEVEPRFPFGYNYLRPYSGTIPEDFPYSKIKLVKLDIEAMSAEFSKDIKLPLKPFFGSMGIAPPQSCGRISSRPPGFHGGNLDNKELVAGSKLFLPIHVKGALFSVGDGHALQGDGEVNGTAVESSMQGKLCFKIRRDLSIEWPLGETPTHIMSMGFHEDLEEATKMALKNMIQFLVVNKKIDADEAYMLSSIAVDFHITQTVNGVKGVHGLLPKKIFQK